MRTIQKILIANRGEIAIRIARTCRDMGIASVTVFSDDDAGSAHAFAGDESVRLSGVGAASTYLSTKAILDAARGVHADAIHPGYGFLSENAEFAAACEQSGLCFIGPASEAIAAMGLKDAAKELARKANVPIVPGYEGADQSVAAFAERARSIGYPVLLKAIAGGGGKGMRIVARADELSIAFDACKREAQAAFGNAMLLMEKYIEGGRHIEFQILGDTHGNLVHLSERECSIQRRHQKIVEETPAPGLADELRARMGRAALDVARAINYSSAGTVEFIVAPSGEFYFLEVNTRLQVEHPITEAVTGLDLVREQIQVARGDKLSITQDGLCVRGVAIESRVCAEDPQNSFLPATGTVHAYEVPVGEGIRVDSGIREGNSVGVHYDSLLAKVIVHGATRTEAIARMQRALREFVALGVRTNRAYLLDVIRSKEFHDARLDTHFLSRFVSNESPSDRLLALEAAVLVGVNARRLTQRVLPGLRPSYRNNGAATQSLSFLVGSATKQVEYRATGPNTFAMQVDDVVDTVVLVSCNAGKLVLERNGVRQTVHYATLGAETWIQTPSSDWHVVETAPGSSFAHAVDANACRAPMPGKVVRMHVRAGSVVERGATLLVLEAMKMEHAVVATRDAVVKDVSVSMGSQVQANQVLVVMEE